MDFSRAVVVLIGVPCFSACALPAPDYKLIQYPAPYRKEFDGSILDNEDMQLNAEGYRVDSRGQRIGKVSVDAKTAGETSNAVAGYYISSLGSKAPGNIMVPSEGAAAGPGYGPGSANPTPLVPPGTGTVGR